MVFVILERIQRYNLRLSFSFVLFVLFSGAHKHDYAKLGWPLVFKLIVLSVNSTA